MKLMKFITIIAIILFVSLTNKSLLPMSSEIDNMEILKLSGLDYNKEDKTGKATLSFMMEKEEGGIGGADESKKEYQEVMTYTASSFNDAVRQMQFYTDKNIAGSHVKYFLIGEETAKSNIDNALEPLAKDKEVRLSSHIYLIKSMSAESFLNEVVNSEYKLTEKLMSMEEKSSEKTIINYLTLSELLSSKLSKNSTYLVPTLQIVSSDDLNIKKEEENESKSEGGQNKEKRFDFYGYGIMKGTKLISYINQDESIIYNMLINKFENGNIDIDVGSGGMISFGINDLKTDYNFKFNNKKGLKQININVEFRSNFEEVQTTEDITTEKNISKYERIQQQKIKKQIEELITKSQKLNIDILGIGQKLKIKHPYKYKVVEKSFQNNYKNMKINVRVKANIDRTYDIYQINK